MTPGRNELCFCASGKKFKHCHGDLTATASSAFQPREAVPPQVAAALRAKLREHETFRARHGAVKETISLESNGMRIVAAGKTVYWGRWRTFHEFLNEFLQRKLGKEWGEAQMALPPADQHPIVQWQNLSYASQVRATRGADGFLDVSTGAANACLRLAYDLYVIEHNADLQRKLLRRLRDPVAFQGGAV